MREVERYRRDIVMHNSMHSLGSGDSLLGRGWTLFHSGDALGERQWARVDILSTRGFVPCVFGLGNGS